MSLRRSTRLSAGTRLEQTSTPALEQNSTTASKPTANSKKKVANLNKTQKNDSKGESTPQTPQKKRRKVQIEPAAADPPGFKSLPTDVELLAEPASVATPRKRKTRPAEPHITNALLKTPKGSRIAAYPPSQAAEDPLPIKGLATHVPKPSTTTDDLLKQACAHLVKVDPKLKVLVEQHQCRTFSPEGLQEEIDPFTSLASSIMAQQVSGAAAQSIKNKFVALFDVPQDTRNPFPTPYQVAETDLAKLRTAGLSGRKAEYIKGLAEKFASGELNARMLLEATDEEVLEKLTAVRGLGRWSVEMFSCFSLKRMDVFSTGDLGVQRGMAAYMGKDVNKLKAKGGKWKYMSEQDMIDIAAKFSPYRSLFMWYMWRIEGIDINAITGD